MVPKQRVSKNKNKEKKANLSPVNLGGVLEGYNKEDNNVTFLGFQFTGTTLVNDQDMFGVNDLIGDKVVMDATTSENVEQNVEKEVSTVDLVTTAGEVVTTAGIEVSTAEVTTTAITPQVSKDELTLAQTLIEIKAAKPKAKGVMIQEPSEFITTPTPQPSQPKDKGKAKMVKPERPLKKKEQIMMDEQVARELEAQMKAEME
nr:hypothetical protein [Tanacetum cinerariifolium]